MRLVPRSSALRTEIMEASFVEKDGYAGVARGFSGMDE